MLEKLKEKQYKTFLILSYKSLFVNNCDRRIGRTVLPCPINALFGGFLLNKQLKKRLNANAGSYKQAVSSQWKNTA